MTIKENQIYFFIFLFGYGFFGAGITFNHNLDIVYLLSPVPFFLSIFFLKKENEVLFQIDKKLIKLINLKEFISIIIIFLFLFFLVFEKISLSITEDEYAYANFGLIHSNFIVSLASNYSIFNDLEIRHLFRFISLFLLVSFFLYFYILKLFFKKRIFYKIIALILSVILIRYLIFKFGGNPFPHPPLISLSSLISTSLFGLSDFSLKLTPFLIYIFFTFYYFFKLRKFNNNFISLLISTSLFGIPGVLYLGSNLEQSLFSMICFSIVAIELLVEDKCNYKKLFIIILFFSLFRVLSILSLSLIVAHVLFISKSTTDFYDNTIKTIKQSYPLLLTVPFVFFSFTSYEYLTVDRIGSQFISIKFFLYDLPFSIIDSFTIIPAIVFLILFIGLIFFFKKSAYILLFLIVNIFVYGNVVESHSKYIYEIFFPILLFLIIIYSYLIKSKWFRNIVISFAVLISFSNIIILKNFNTLCLSDESPFKENRTYKTKFGCKIISTIPFDFSTSYNFLKQNKNFSFKNLYVPGVYYGLLPSIINGMKVSEYIDHKEINSNQNTLNEKNMINWTSGNADNINMDDNINFILAADLSNSKKLIKELINSGWAEIHKNIDPNFYTSSTVLYKKD